MKHTTYLTIDKNGIKACRKSKPNLKAGEIAVRLDINIPAALFEQFIPKVDIKLNEGNIILPEVEVSQVGCEDEITLVRAEELKRGMICRLHDDIRDVDPHCDIHGNKRWEVVESITKHAGGNDLMRVNVLAGTDRTEEQLLNESDLIWTKKHYLMDGLHISLYEAGDIPEMNMKDFMIFSSIHGCVAIDRVVGHSDCKVQFFCQDGGHYMWDDDRTICLIVNDAGDSMSSAEYAEIA